MSFYLTKNVNFIIKESIAKNKYTISNKQNKQNVSNLQNLKHVTTRIKKGEKNVILMEDLQNSDLADPPKNSKSQKCHNRVQKVRKKSDSAGGSLKFRSALPSKIQNLKNVTTRFKSSKIEVKM